VPRIAGVDLPAEKRVEVSLTYIFGIGHATAKKILDATGVDPATKTKNLSEDDTAKLRNVIESTYKVEGALRSEVSGNIKRLMDIGCYRGLRHRRGLPVRGQRTHTNARTRKGPKKGVMTRKKKESK
jgi:small subunit ribosomal protein S13